MPKKTKKKTAKKKVVKQKTPKKTRKLPRLDPRWTLFKNYYATPSSKTIGNIYKSAVKAGFAKSYANTLSGRSGLGKVRISLSEALEKKGITSDYISGKIKELMDAAIIKKTKIIKIAGGIEETTEKKIDSHAINAGVTHAAKVRGDYKETSINTEVIESRLSEIEKVVRDIAKK